MGSPNPRMIVIIVSLSSFAFLLGVITGYFPRSVHKDSSEKLIEKLNRDGDWSLFEQFKEFVDTGYIDKVIRDLTRRPGLAGTPQQKQNAEYILDLWQQQGLKAEIVQYKVLLSYPKGNHTNKVSLYNASGRVMFTSKPHEKALVDEETPEEVVQPFNAYSPNGFVKGDLVYVNYGRAEDFERLNEAGINVSGKIAIARYGKIFRGNKVKFAEDNGAIGIILYSYPADYNTPGDERYFPGGMWLPGSGVQRGNVVLVKGDQSTQGYPSTNYLYRPDQEEIFKQFPSIPCHPIGYEDAYFLLSSLVSGEVWQDWQGSLNFTYNITGLVDNRDSWVYGAVDPISGTSILMETARIFAKSYSSGWRPRRSIVICSWDAEEYGLLGLYEWVEDNMKWLQNEAAIYVNLAPESQLLCFALSASCIWPRLPGESGDCDLEDFAIKSGGNYTFSSWTVPLLHDAVYKATMVLPSPYNSSVTLYQDWRSKSESRSELPEPKRIIGIIREIKDIRKNLSSENSELRSQQVRMINDKLQSVERAFVVPEGLPLRPMYRHLRSLTNTVLTSTTAHMHAAITIHSHLMQSPSGLNYYGGTGFPGLEDLSELSNSNPKKWLQIRKHVTILTHSMYSLATFLEKD